MTFKNTYELDHVVREELGTSENNMTHMLGRGHTTLRTCEDYNPLDMHNPITPFDHQGTPSRLQMQVDNVNVTEAYPKTRVEDHLTNKEDKE